MTSLSERYRPKKLEDLVGQAKIAKRINLLRQNGGLQGRVLWLVGESGSGKTSLARIVANECADPYAIVEKDAQEYSMDFVRQLERMCQCKPLGEKMCHVFICNEAHRLSDKVVSRLQTVLEEPCVQRNSTWIFTTTCKGQAHLFDERFDACPFLSRATILEFETRGDQLVLDFACHVRKIAQAEKCDGKPIGDYVELVKQHRFNLRSCINAVESGAMLD
jgi:replication-associated recombination protein RarA